MAASSRQSFRLFGALLCLCTASAGQSEVSNPEIVVTATREQQAALAELKPERTIDQDGVLSYGASTIGEVLEFVASENGDADAPVIFVNGIPVKDPGDITDYPAEAISRIDVLPRGAGARLGAATDRRAYNIVLKRVFASNIGTIRGQFATDGGYAAFGGEATFSRIAGQRRLNVTFRARDEDEIRESERGLLQPTARFPYALAGNLFADPSSGSVEIDPALSSAAGQIITLAAVPANNPNPTLANFVATAGQPNVTDLGQYRTVRPAQRTHEMSLSANTPLTSWLSASLTGRIEQNAYTSLQGLRAAVFVLPTDSPFSPFTRPVAIARYFEEDPLAGKSKYLRGNVGLALNATRGNWQITARGDYRYSRFKSKSQRQRQSPTTPILLDVSAPNPFGELSSGLVDLYLDRSSSTNKNSAFALSATGPVVNLPAGPVRANLNASLRHIGQSGFNENPFFSSSRSLDRHERAGQASIEIPLTSRENKTLAAVGDLSVTLDYGITDVRKLGAIRRHGVALNWRPIERITLQGSLNKQRLLPEAEQIGEAVIVSEGVRFFDVVTGETLDVSQISGGNPDLLPEKVLTRRLSATAMLLPRINLQFNAEYLATKRSNPISSLPPTSIDLIAAFPERFIRDADGRLVTVDARPVNFERRSSEQFRWGINLAAPLYDITPSQAPSVRGKSRPRLQASIGHSINLADQLVARPGFSVVDLLDGGAIGFGGGGTRHTVDAGVNLSDREVGIRLNASWRSASRLNLGTLSAPTQLRFSSLALVNIRTFADLQQLGANEKWLKGTRLSFGITNAFNKRQRVIDNEGNTPLRYQRGYRDPVGRAIEVEIRKAF
ncbi:hypothetical protein [Sphingorhabdus sp.]|uniref:hypothetical protein n=1 Tax=Sphingorhabdus sp. TaxID=1902408 RepID=UPI00391C9E9B